MVYIRDYLVLCINKFVCFVFGHKPRVPKLTETEHTIYSFICPRCKTIDRFTYFDKNSPLPVGISRYSWSVFTDKYRDNVIKNEYKYNKEHRLDKLKEILK